MKNVLSLTPKEKIIICDGAGREAECLTRSFVQDRVRLFAEKVNENTNEPEKDVALFLATLKKENFELTVQKAVEIGVKEITPLITERTVKFGLKTEKLEKIIREAAEQSGR